LKRVFIDFQTSKGHFQKERPRQQRMLQRQECSEQLLRKRRIRSPSKKIPLHTLHTKIQDNHSVNVAIKENYRQVLSEEST